MSNIAEKKAEKLFPFRSIEGGEIEAYFNAGQLHKREIYIECYDQIMQNFLEKAEKFFKNELYVSVSDQICSQNDFTSMSNFIEQFKNYIQKIA